jgi:hypothetical protein
MKQIMFLLCLLGAAISSFANPFTTVPSSVVNAQPGYIVFFDSLGRPVSTNVIPANTSVPSAQLTGIISPTNLPTGSTNALTNAGQFVAATNGVAAGLIVTNGMTISAGGNTATLTLAGQSMGATTNLVRSYPGGLLLGNLSNSILVDPNGAVWANTFIGGVNTSNLNGQINPTNLPAMPFVNVLQHGVTNDGVTDVTINLQNLLNQGGAFYFPPGRYLSRELQITNNTALLFNGATLVYAINAWNTNIFIREMLNTNISIFGTLELDGQMYPNIATNTFQTYQGAYSFTVANGAQFYLWNPYGLRHGFQFNTEARGTIDQVQVHGFNGIGVLPLSINGTSSMGTPKTCLKSANCYSNLIGFYSVEPFTFPGYITNWITNYIPNAQTPEYMYYQNLHCGLNTVGIVFEAGNSVLANSDISGNVIDDLEISFGQNDHHGSMVGVMFNHAQVAPLVANQIKLGENYIGCHFDGNANNVIYMAGCCGMHFSGCDFFTDLAITNLNTSSSGTLEYNIMDDCTYRGAWSTIPFVSDGQLIMRNNFSWDTVGDLPNITIAATGVTNYGPRQAIAMITASSTIFWVSNLVATAASYETIAPLCIATNSFFSSSTGTISIPLESCSCIHAASGLSGYMYFPN